MNPLVDAVLIVAFWLCVLEIAYSYALYPLALRLLARLFGRPVKSSPFEPSVAVVIPVYNEEKVIAAKIANIFASDYDPARLSVWVGSDCSTDRTEELIRNCGDPRVKLWRAPARCGKAGILNQLVPQVDAEVVVFTDADILFDRAGLRMLARNFADPEVGGVAGATVQRKAGADIANEETGYRNYETRLKTLEARLHSTISAFGSFFAVRKDLFVPFHPHTYSNDDVMLPMNVVRQGKRMYFENAALSFEDAQEELAVEFKRRIRICAGNFQAFFWLLDFLNPARGWPWFCYVSHKVTRWFSPLFLLLGALCCAVLAFVDPALVYKVFLLFGIIGVAASLFHKIVPLPLGRQAFYFLAINAAALLGFCRFLGGIRSAVWARTERG